MNLKSGDGLEYLREEYVLGGKSTYQIAEDLETYPNAVRSALIFHGIRPRSRGEAQKAAIQSGRALHPTEGRELSPEEKLRISESVAASWRSSPSSQRTERALKSKDAWESRSVDDLAAMVEKAVAGTHRAAREGSRLERHLHAAILAAGHDAEFHRVHLVVNEKMHVDIVVRSPPVAIEVDGPAHHFPIWGEERLEKTREADRRKDGLLLQGGLVVLRVKALAKRYSEAMLREAAAEVLAVLAAVKDRFPPEGERCLEVVVGERKEE